MSNKSQKTRSQLMKERWADPVFREEMHKKLSKAKKGRPSNRLGIKHTEEARRKMSEKKRLWYGNPENLAKAGQHLIGKKQSKEWILKKIEGMKRWWKESPKADERRKKLIEMIRSEKHRKKVSKALKGRPKSEEHIKKLSGANGSNWQGGKTFEPYSEQFNKQNKKKIKERDKYTCQNPQCRIRKNLTIHHIDYNKKNCNQNNLITLCYRCNSKANFNREYWTAFYKSIVQSN